MSNEYGVTSGNVSGNQTLTWNAVADKAISGLLMLGLASLGILVGIMATLVFIDGTFEATAMQNYVGLALVHSPTWFKALYLGTVFTAPFGILRVGAPVVSAVRQGVAWGWNKVRYG